MLNEQPVLAVSDYIPINVHVRTDRNATRTHQLKSLDRAFLRIEGVTRIDRAQPNVHLSNHTGILCVRHPGVVDMDIVVVLVFQFVQVSWRVTRQGKVYVRILIQDATYGTRNYLPVFVVAVATTQANG